MNTEEQLDGKGIDAVGQFETRGVDYIPLAERHSKPRELTYVFFGTQLCFSIIILGYIPVTFGLGWWGSVTSTLVGLAVGSLLFAPLALLSTRTGTNTAVSSGAHLGVVGRVVGSLIGIFTAVGFYGLAVWTGGEALVAGLKKLTSLPYNNWTLAVAYAVISAIVLIVATYGHANVVLANRFLIPSMGVLMIVLVIVLGHKFHSAPAASGHGLALGHFAATWILSASTAASLPISYSPYVGDYTRYVSPMKWSPRRVVTTTFVGMFIGCAVALVFAIYVAMTFTPNTTDWIVGLVQSSPKGATIAIVIIALIGSCAQGALCVYGTGMDASSIIPALKRIPATLLIGFLGAVLVYVGSFAYNLVSFTSAFLILLLVVTAPWMVINIVGYVLNRGRYYAHDLQVFNMNPRVKAGAYWFTHGWNVAGTVAWLVATVVGLLFVNTTIYVGPLANAVGGVDLSFISAAVLGGVIFYSLAKLIPSTIVAPAQVSEEEDAERLTALLRNVDNVSASPQLNHLRQAVPVPDPDQA